MLSMSAGSTLNDVETHPFRRRRPRRTVTPPRAVAGSKQARPERPGPRRSRDRVQRGPQLVRHARQEAVLGADGVFEFLVLLLKSLLEALALGNVADLDGKLAAVLAQAIQLEANTHRTCPWFALIPGAMASVDAAEPVRQQDFNWSPDQLIARIPT